MAEFSIRPAQAEDLPAIRALVWAARVNPLGIKWAHFLAAVDSRGLVIGCGQVKRHRDGTQELASIVVTPAWRNRGVARAIITGLVERHPQELFLMCRAELAPFYEKFAFHAIHEMDMPPYFRRLKRLSKIVEPLLPTGASLCVMQRTPGSKA